MRHTIGVIIQVSVWGYGHIVSKFYEKKLPSIQLPPPRMARRPTLFSTDNPSKKVSKRFFDFFLVWHHKRTSLTQINKFNTDFGTPWHTAGTLECFLSSLNKKWQKKVAWSYSTPRYNFEQTLLTNASVWRHFIFDVSYLSQFRVLPPLSLGHYYFIAFGIDPKWCI